MLLQQWTAIKQWLLRLTKKNNNNIWLNSDLFISGLPCMCYRTLRCAIRYRYSSLNTTETGWVFPRHAAVGVTARLTFKTETKIRRLCSREFPRHHDRRNLLQPKVKIRKRSICDTFWLLMLPAVKCQCNKPKPLSAVCVLTQAHCLSPGCQSKASHKLLWQKCYNHLRVTKRVDSARHFAFCIIFISRGAFRVTQVYFQS